MNFLVDRHQADLFYSLQLLFEDRLGGQVFTPIGHEWWDEGYWQFGTVFGDDRLAQQYLCAPDFVIGRAEPLAWATTYDSSHPTRPVHGLTLDAAREIGIDFAVATVQENQAGFDRFAKEQGAKSVYHVGNTRQGIDWSLDPLCIITSESTIEGRGVRVHQEIESGPGQMFGFCDPEQADRKAVASYINLFPRLAEQFELFEQARGKLPEWGFYTYGIDGLDGNVKPTAAIAEGMGKFGFGWHDKPTGDGYGHMVHGWAAVGRPLIGHAAHYRGQLAEPFWQDGLTCLDLGARTVPETVRMMQEIAADPARHELMCIAIREMFDILVDYEAEAALVADLLGLVPPSGG